HAHVVAAPDERNGADQLHVVAGRRAAAAEDAGLAVENEEALGRVHRKVVMRGMARGGEGMARGRFADLTEAVAAVTWSEHGPGQVEHGLARLDGVGMPRVDDHAVTCREVAGGRQAALPLDVDEAGAACAQWRAPGILAELGQGNVKAVDGVQHRRSSGDLDRRPVDGQFHRTYLSSAANSRSAESIDRGAACPRPQREATRTTSESSAIAAWSSEPPASSMSRSLAVPSRHGVHLPQDSLVL